MFLHNCRVLDLTDERGLFCGKLLADLGAEVIAVEPLGGSPARHAWPFLDEATGPSLLWWCYAAGKKGITLDVTSATGRDLLLRLVQVSDALVESWDPGHLDRLGLGYDVLHRANPSLVVTSVTPFGQEGPYAGYQATDLVLSALGGLTYVTGDPDRPPVRVSFPQASLLGGASAALGTALALHHRTRTGQGQWVDASSQEAVVKALDRNLAFWEFGKTVLPRTGFYGRPGGGPFRRLTFPCKDGYVNCAILAGTGSRSTRALLDWMAEDGHDVASLQALPWEEMRFADIPLDVLEQATQALLRFFPTKTKAELWKRAQAQRLLIYPAATPREVVESASALRPHLFQRVSSPEAGRSLTTLAPFVHAGSTSPQPAPALGQHNQEVYQGLLGLSRRESESLRAAGVI